MDLRPRTSGAFTLVELLAVMVIIIAVLGLSTLAITSLNGANSLTMSAAILSDILQQARVYATSNHTYVYVGLQEASSSTATTGVGHVSVAVVASVTGTRPYTTPQALTSSGVSTVGKLEYLDNVDITSTTVPTNGNLAARPTPATTLPAPGFLYLGNSNVKSTVTFTWPLSGTAQHTFAKVIEFDPQGVARVQQSSTAFDPTIPAYIEVDLLPTHGAVASTTVTNAVVIQIDGMTGAVRTYRP